MDDIIPFPVSIVPAVGGDPWVVLESPEQVELYFREWGNLANPSRVVCWADLPSKADEVEVPVVYFRASRSASTPFADVGPICSTLIAAVDDHRAGHREHADKHRNQR